MTKSQKSRLIRRLSAVGLPQRRINSMVNTVEKWILCSGPEWTVQRLKALKADLLAHFGGVIQQTPWVAYKQHKGTIRPKGPLGFLWDASSQKDKMKAINALMLYSDYTSTDVTKTQWRKFHDSVVRITDFSNHELLSKGKSQGKRLRRRLPRRRLIQATQFIPSPSRRCPTWDGGSVPESDWGLSLHHFIKTEFGGRMYLKYSQIREVLDPVGFRRSDSTSIEVMTNPMGMSYPLPAGTVGRISFIQEPGYKLRAVANPNRIYQLALRPMAKQLDSILRSLPWDCTHDQQSGVNWAMEQFHQGKTLYCVDLSDATNNFPLVFQLHVLRGLGIQSRDISLFQDLSRGPWSVRDPESGKEKSIRWGTGQPLGLEGSFQSFALAHGLLLYELSREEGKLPPMTKVPFRVLGDDVIISDESLHTRYREALSVLGAPISEHKSIASRLLAEFAGKIITPQGVISPVKWKQVSDRNFLDFIREIGPKGYQFLRTRQRDIVKYLSDIPEPLGGLGWNPKGLSLEDRLNGKEELLNLESDRMVKTVQAHTDQMARWYSNDALQSILKNRSGFTRKEFRTRSTRSGLGHKDGGDLKLRVVEALRINSEVLHEGIISSGLDRYGIRLSSDTSERDPRGISALQVWERKIPGYPRQTSNH